MNLPNLAWLPANFTYPFLTASSNDTCLVKTLVKVVRSTTTVTSALASV